MTREWLLEMALKIAVDKIRANERAGRGCAPITSSLEAVVEKTQNEGDIALIQYLYDHPGA